MPQLNGTMGQIGNSLGPMSDVFSAIATGVGGYNQARASKAEGAYQKQIYDSNAAIADIQAQDAIDRGDKNAVELKKQSKKLIGAQRAALAAQGIEVNADSALGIQLDTAGQAATDALTIKNNAWREAWGYKVQSANYTAQGAMADMAGKNKARNTILTTGLNITKDLTYSQYLKKNKTVPRYSSTETD